MVGDSEPLDCESLKLTNRCAFISKPASQNFIHNTILSLLISTGASSPQQAQASSSMALPSASMVETGGGRRILLAEDNKFNRNYVSALLRENNFDVTEASNGSEALELVTVKAFDLILMDIHLPESDGITIAERIKTETGPNRATPVLALTADLYVQETADYRNAGFAGIIAKPIDEVRFWQVVGKHLRQPDGVSSTAESDRLEKIKQSLLPQLLQELPEYSRHIQQAFDAREHDRLVDQLHQLKGVSGYVKLSTLSAIVSETEHFARNTRDQVDWDGLAPLIRRLQDHIDILTAQMSP
jgi:CheY-like chemotaxis protein